MTLTSFVRRGTLNAYWKAYFHNLFRVLAPTTLSLSGGGLLWILYWHFSQLIGLRYPRWQLTANPALLGLVTAIFAIPAGTIIQRHIFKSRVERASCVVALCLGLLLLSILAAEVGFTPPQANLPDNIVLLVFVIYVGCVAFPAVRLAAQPDAKRLTREPRLKDWTSKARNKKRASRKRK